MTVDTPLESELIFTFLVLISKWIVYTLFIVTVIFLIRIPYFIANMLKS